MKRLLLGAAMLLLMAGAVTGCGSWWFTGGVLGNQNNYWGRASGCTVQLSADQPSGWAVERMDAAYYANGNIYPYQMVGSIDFVAMNHDFHWDWQNEPGHQLWNQAPVGGNGSTNGAQVLVGIWPGESFHPGFKASTLSSIANLSSRIEISDANGNRSVLSTTGAGCELRNDP